MTDSIRHGPGGPSLTGYTVRKCRCRSCRDLNAEYHRRYRAEHRSGESMSSTAGITQLIARLSACQPGASLHWLLPFANCSSAICRCPECAQAIERLTGNPGTAQILGLAPDTTAAAPAPSGQPARADIEVMDADQFAAWYSAQPRLALLHAADRIPQKFWSTYRAAIGQRDPSDAVAALGGRMPGRATAGADSMPDWRSMIGNREPTGAGFNGSVIGRG